MLITLSLLYMFFFDVEFSDFVGLFKASECDDRGVVLCLLDFLDIVVKLV